MTPEYAYAALADEQERERLVLEHLPQVQYIARRIHDRLPAHVPLADLVQAGVVGLMDALAKYDAQRSVQFDSYASFRIRGAILDSLRELDWGPRELRRKARRVQEATRKVEHALGRSATEMEVAEAMGLTLGEFQALLGELRGLDLAQLTIESEDGQEVIDVPGNPEESPYACCVRSEMKAVLAGEIATLPEKEQQVLSLYYHEELTMKEVGAVLGVGESRICQIHSMAIVRLRARLARKLGREATCKAVAGRGR
jgi:RNA polymerase sigma factor for flagellar operon FliA